MRKRGNIRQDSFLAAQEIIDDEEEMDEGDRFDKKLLEVV